MRRQALEDRLVDRLVRGFSRDPLQLNRPHESDAELMAIPGTNSVLAVTVDQIVEEIRVGLYDDPYLLGWMTVVASASDLAAVGAEPLGTVIGQTLPRNTDSRFLDRLQQGIADASTAANLPVLGGDTAFDEALSMSATAFGLVSDGRPLTRYGARADHHLLASGPLGLGSVFAWARRQGRSAPAFRPQVRLAVGATARRHASAAIDTSDGFLAACDLLLPPDGLDLEIRSPLSMFLHPAAGDLARMLSVPEWFLLAGPHGEFELLLAVPENRVSSLCRETEGLGVPLLELGVFRPGTGAVRIPRANIAVDPAQVRDLHSRAGEDPRAFLEALPDCTRPLEAFPGKGAYHAHR